MNSSVKPVATIAALSVVLALTPVASHAISAGDPNPPKDANGNYIYPPDSPNNPYNPVTQTGRLDTLDNNGALLSPFSGVGTIDNGTGELIDSTHVLTAAHLFGGSNVIPPGLTFNLDNGQGGQTSFAVESVVFAPGYAGDPGPQNPDDSGDVAVVTLSAPVPATYQTYPIYTGPLNGGTVLTLAGFGQTGDGVNGYINQYGPRRIGKVSADGFLLPDGQTIASSYQAGDHTYVFEFYSPQGYPNPAPNYLGGASLGNDVETTIGGGDSGSPAFIQVNGRYVVAALNNFAEQYGDMQNPGPAPGLFGSGGGGAILSAYRSFIASADPSAVFTSAPEPSSFAVLGLGALGVGASALKARRRKA